MGIRLATTEDFEAIFELLSELHSYPLDRKAVQAQLEYVVNDPQRDIFLAVDDDGTPLGTATVNIVYRIAKLECRIDEVTVSEKARGKGIGSLLMDACEQWAWDHGAQFIELTSRPSREGANVLYQKLGYFIHETNVYNKNKES